MNTYIEHKSKLINEPVIKSNKYNKLYTLAQIWYT